jgi:pyruvate dehydrogenase E1 component
MNENYQQPDLPMDASQGVIKGCYQFKTIPAKNGKQELHISLLGSGAIMTEVVKAAEILSDHGISVELFSVTSWSELSREGRLAQDGATPYITQLLGQSKGPIIAATDYVHAVPESIRAYIPNGRSYETLGTDGFGRSDTRAALREFFGVDAVSIVKAALKVLN